MTRTTTDLRPWTPPSGESGFRNEPLGDAVALGAIEPHAARVWLRARRPGGLTVRWWPAAGAEADAHELLAEVPSGCERDGTLSLRLPPEGSTLPSLEALRRYRWRARYDDGEELGGGAFETAPAGGDGPERFSFALMSCHQPFTPEGELAPHVAPMLDAVHEVLRRHEAKLVLMMGDQMYADLPAELSLFRGEHFRSIAPPGRERLRDCSAREVRRLYQQRYRHFWNVPGWRRLLAEYPCYPILDDHELIDNWGSHPDHQEREWRSVGIGARAAYLDYQGSRVRSGAGVPPDDFDHGFSYGAAAFHVVDLRSERRAGEGARLLSPRQHERLERFLAEHADKRALFLVLSVPAVHLPRGLARFAARITPPGEDFSDRWSSAGHRGDRDRVLHALREHSIAHPHQSITLLSGDIHIGCVHAIQWEEAGVRMHQVISSGVTNRTGALQAFASAMSILANRRVWTKSGLSARVRPLRGEPRHDRNPFRELNIGLVELRRDPRSGDLDQRFLLYGCRDGEPLLAFRSPPIRGGAPAAAAEHGARA